MLTSLDRVKTLLTGLSPSDDLELTDMAEVASASFESITQRRFNAANYDIFFDGADDVLWHVPEFPIISVSRVQFLRITALTIHNTTDQATTSSALVDIVDGVLTLSLVVNGVSTSNSLTLASYATVTALATAVNLLSGWTCSVAGNYGSWPATELVAPWYKSALGTVNLEVYGQDVPYTFRTDESGEILSPFGFRRGGRNTYRLRYRGGYECIPAEIQGCVAELTSIMWGQKGINVNLQSESLDTYSYSTASERTLGQLSYRSQGVIGYYARKDVVNWRI